MKNEQPLISIAIITYNSSKYVLETLESMKAQTYRNIELIISDDCSTDNTVDICKDWIETNRDEFVRIELITVDKNTGITANANRALHLTEGKWIKLIAGDDIFFPQAVESHVKFISRAENEDAVIIMSSVQLFKNTIENKLCVWPDFKFPDSRREQLRRQLTGCFIMAPGVFIKREILVNKFGGFNEKYPMFEDDPLWISYLSNGYKFYFNSDILAGYRMHDSSVSRTQFKVDFFNNLISFKKEIVLPLMLKNGFYLEFLLCLTELYLIKKNICKGNRFLVKIIVRINTCLRKVLSLQLPRTS